MAKSQPVSEGIRQIHKLARAAVALEPGYRNLPRCYIKGKLRQVVDHHMWIVDVEMLDSEGKPLDEFSAAKERYRLAMDYLRGPQ